MNVHDVIGTRKRNWKYQNTIQIILKLFIVITVRITFDAAKKKFQCQFEILEDCRTLGTSQNLLEVSSMMYNTRVNRQTLLCRRFICHLDDFFFFRFFLLVCYNGENNFQYLPLEKVQKLVWNWIFFNFLDNK